MRSMNFRIVVDVMLIIALLLSMTYLLIGIDNHEIVGTVFFILMAVHIVLNRKWFFNIFKGKYFAMRILRTILNLIMLAMLLCLMISGFIFATYTPSFIKTAESIDIARTFHLTASYWCFVLFSIHLGMNLNVVANMIKMKTAYREIFRFIGIIAACYGVFALMKHDLLSYMFLKQDFIFFDPGQTLTGFLIDYAAIMSFCSMIGCSIVRLCINFNPYKANKRMKIKGGIE